MRRGSVHACKCCSHSGSRQLLSRAPCGLVVSVKEFLKAPILCKVHVANMNLWHTSDCVYMQSLVGLSQ